MKKKKTVKILNTNVFHKKATDKENIHMKHSDHFYRQSRAHCLYNTGPH